MIEEFHIRKTRIYLIIKIFNINKINLKIKIKGKLMLSLFFMILDNNK